MKRTPLLVVAALAVFAGCAGMTIDDAQLGLSRTGVFDVATPAPFDFEGAGSGETVAPVPGSGMPPMISHSIDDSLPITVAKNDCLACHARPAPGSAAKRKATTMPVSHYVSGAGAEPRLNGRNYNCVACHAPQSGAKPLVGNTSG